MICLSVSSSSLARVTCSFRPRRCEDNLDTFRCVPPEAIYSWGSGFYRSYSNTTYSCMQMLKFVCDTDKKRLCPFISYSYRDKNKDIYHKVCAYVTHYSHGVGSLSSYKKESRHTTEKASSLLVAFLDSAFDIVLYIIISVCIVM